MRNCSRHGNLLNTLTQRLTDLLEYFESPDEDMRTFIQPEKTKATVSSKPDNLNGTGGKSAFSEAALQQMSDFDKVTPMKPSNDVTTSAIVHIGPAAGSIPESRTTFMPNKSNGTSYTGPAHPTSQRSDGVSRLGHGKGYKAHERHHFVRVHTTSFTSCASPTGAYSETVLVLWVDSKAYHKYQSSTDKYRVVISLMYDAEDDLWSVSAKLLKRTSYSQKDDEEGNIANRLCITSELRTEVKKMLLFLGISPREAYKMFRRNMEENFVVSPSDYGFITVESASHSKLMKDMEKASTSSVNSTYWDNHGGYYGPHGHMNPRHRMRERDARQSHLQEAYSEGWPGMD